jgi:hypothetical protein
VYGPVKAMVASLQFGAAGLVTRVESAVATDAATAQTAVTAETATTMAFLIDMLLLRFPRFVVLPDVTSAPSESCRERLDASSCPSSSQESDTGSLSCQQPSGVTRAVASGPSR